MEYSWPSTALFWERVEILDLQNLASYQLELVDLRVETRIHLEQQQKWKPVILTVLALC